MKNISDIATINIFIKGFSITTLLLSFMMFNSCEDDVTLQFPEYESKIVVEGSIEQGDVARVILTRSSGFFEEINYDKKIEVDFNGTIIEVPEILYKTLVLDALVTVSDGSEIDTLTMSVNPNIFPYIYYVGSKITGVPGMNYSLNINSEGTIVQGVTTIPNPVAIDSLWFEFYNDTEDTLGYIYGQFDDPADEVNFYRVLTKSEGRDSSWVHPFNSVGHDRNINGEEDNTIVIYHGDNKLENVEDRNRWYFKLGEKVTVKFCTIDKKTYDFWYSYQQNQTGGNPFAEPVPLSSNVTGGIGVWGGYAISEMDFVVEYIEPTEE